MRSGIALPAGATTKLVIDAAAFVPFRTQDMQTPQCEDLFLIGLTFRFNLFVSGFLAVLGQLLILVQHTLEQKVWIASEQNVGSAAGHVRRDRHGALLARPAR